MISLRLNLAKFPHVLMKKKGKSGKEIEGIFIPIENARLFKSDKGNVFLDVVGFEIKNPKEGQDDTHILKQSLSKDERDKMSEEEKQAMPIIGNARVSSYNGEGSPTGNAELGKTFSADDDDLPF